MTTLYEFRQIVRELLASEMEITGAGFMVDSSSVDLDVKYEDKVYCITIKEI